MSLIIYVDPSTATREKKQESVPAPEDDGALVPRRPAPTPPAPPKSNPIPYPSKEEMNAAYGVAYRPPDQPLPAPPVPPASVPDVPAPLVINKSSSSQQSRAPPRPPRPLSIVPEGREDDTPKAVPPVSPPPKSPRRKVVTEEFMEFEIISK